MKRITAIIGIMIIGVCFIAANAHAEVVSFTDNHKYWDGWGNGTNDDSHDVIGIPNFTGGQATIENDRLNNLTFNRAAGTTSYWGALSPGDLFINIGNDNTWDYVVDLTNWTIPGPTDPDAVAGNYDIFSISLALDSTTGYILSGLDRQQGWSNYYIRDSHPVAANWEYLQGQQIGSAYFSGWGNGTTTQYSFNFDGLDLGNSGNFTIGWQPNCANDVVYENLHYTATPEPMTVALVGAGVVGLLRLKRRKA